MKKLILSLLLFCTLQVYSQINQAKVYWVGHSLISHTDSYSPGTDNVVVLMNTLVTSQGKTYDYHRHTTPGAPIGWNWGATADAWADIEPLIQPLLTPSNPDYGTFNAIVVTESIDLHPAYQWWLSSFYTRKFFNAAKAANGATRFFVYESWHHFQASDDGLRDYYGPMATFDWRQYMLDVRPLWEDIIDQASDPALTQDAPDYSYQGPGTDPGLGGDILDIKIIPTGQVLLNVLDRLNANLGTDDWTYNGSPMTALDFFANPLANFPADLTTTVHPADPVDDIHPSNVLIYLNALVQYAVIYQDNPINLPPANGVPANIADIFKEVTWDVVSNDPRTGIPELLPVEYLDPFQAKIIDKKVTLTWSTITVIDNDYFEVERSGNAKQWVGLGKIDAKNNTNTLHKYVAIDSTPLQGHSFYRLKQVDKDGKFSYSKTISIQFSNSDFFIFPNPATTTLRLKTATPRFNYQVINMAGITVIKGHTKNIDISRLPKGLYFIKIKDSVKKFIKK